MIRVVLDTNVIVSALLQPAGPPAQVFILAIGGSLQLCVSANIYAEYEEVIRRPRFQRADDIVAGTLHAIREKGLWVRPATRVHVCPDTDDDMFLECAQAARRLPGNRQSQALPGILGRHPHCYAPAPARCYPLRRVKRVTDGAIPDPLLDGERPGFHIPCHRRRQPRRRPGRIRQPVRVASQVPRDAQGGIVQKAQVPEARRESSPGWSPARRDGIRGFRAMNLPGPVGTIERARDWRVRHELWPWTAVMTAKTPLVFSHRPTKNAASSPPPLPWAAETSIALSS